MALREALGATDEQGNNRCEVFLFFMGSGSGMGNILKLLGLQLQGWAANLLEWNTASKGQGLTYVSSDIARAHSKT